MVQQYLLILVSVVLGVLCVRFLRRFDIHEQEPLWAMLAVAIWGGAWSVALATFGYQLLGRLGFSNFTASLGPLLVIGPVEESAKLLALLTSYPIIRKELDEPTDGLIYMSCVALGFSLIENYFYAIDALGQHSMLALRLVVCTPMHILFSAFMGLAFYWVLRGGARPTVLLWSLAYGSIAHGLYDLAVFNSWAVWSLMIIIWVSFWWVRKLLAFTTANSPHRSSLAAFVAAHHDAVGDGGPTCPRCGDEGDKPRFDLGKIFFHRCNGCGVFVIGKKPLRALFRHFGAAFQRLGKPHVVEGADGRQLTTLYAGNFFVGGEETGYFLLEELDDVLEEMNGNVIAGFENNQLFRFLAVLQRKAA